MRSVVVLWFWLCTGMAALAAPAERVAFVVGNSTYRHAPALKNPIDDAALVASTLGDLGFDTHVHLNLTRADLVDALARFLDETQDAKLTLFYFAGHGFQFDGQNYLMGIDAKLETEMDVQNAALPLDTILAEMERKSRAALVFYDACRNNPVAEAFYRRTLSPSRAVATRGITLLRRKFSGTMITFAAGPGQVAYDGQGENSPFAAALARHLPTPDVEILTLMKRVTRDVRASTGDLQTPVVMNDLTQEIYLNAGSPEVADADDEKTLFEAAAALDTADAWAYFIVRHPDGPYTEAALAARKRLLELEEGVRMAERAAQSAPSENGAEVSRRRSDLTELPGVPGPTVRLPETSDQDPPAVLTRGRIKMIQGALNLFGFNAGPADGVLGARTMRAIAAFQQQAGLPVTGIVTESTVAAMNARLLSQRNRPVAPVGPITIAPSPIGKIQTLDPEVERRRMLLQPPG